VLRGAGIGLPGQYFTPERGTRTPLSRLTLTLQESTIFTAERVTLKYEFKVFSFMFKVGHPTLNFEP